MVSSLLTKQNSKLVKANRIVFLLLLFIVTNLCLDYLLPSCAQISFTAMVACLGLVNRLQEVPARLPPAFSVLKAVVDLCLSNALSL